MAEPKKKGVNGRAKGKKAENEVAKIHVAWWGMHEPGTEFKSTPQSGGFSTPTVRAHFKMAGDLMTTSKIFPFVVEVKRREGFDIRNVYRMKPSPIWGWWRQAVAAARVQGGVPILWFRDGKKGKTAEWFLMVPRFCFTSLPALDPWDQDLALIDTGGVWPMLTTWETLRDCMPIPAIIKACKTFSLSSKETSTQTVPSPPIARNSDRVRSGKGG